MPRQPTGRVRGRPKGSGELGESLRLTVRIPLSLYERLATFAEERVYTRGSPQLAVCVREALIAYLDNKGQTRNVPERSGDNSGQTKNIARSAKDNSGQTENSTLVYDASKYVLGRLCPRRHEHGSTGLSLLRISNRHCIACDREKFRERKAGKGAEGVEAQGRRLGVGGLRRGEVVR